MATNDERREVAQKLRQMYKRLGENADAHEFAHYTADVLDENWRMTWFQMGMRLADLVEPEPERTCRDVGPGGMFVCSECGASLDYEGWHDEPTYWVDGVAAAVEYCPNCRAKVIYGG